MVNSSHKSSSFHSQNWNIRFRSALQTLSTRPLTLLIAGAALIFFLCSSIRHLLFQSTVFDLGIYDQALYLISQGQPPISSLLGIHILGDHASVVFYLLALLYKIYPSVYWLFAVQAVALALGALPTWLLARQAELKPSLAGAVSVSYLLYPVVFNLNLFDFHPEVMALPAMLGAIWAARADKILWFCLLTGLVLSCKDVLSLSIAAMGFWLLIFEKRRFCGCFALVTGISWFLIAVKLIIPAFAIAGQPFGVSRYAYLGNSVFAIARSLFLDPGLILPKVFSSETLIYLFQLIIPLIWGLSPRHFAPLIAAIPPLVLNVLSEEKGQRSLFLQYSLPILPFLLVAVIAALAAKQHWWHRRGLIILWSIVTFFCLTKVDLFWTQYPKTLKTWHVAREAVAQIPLHEGAVIADGRLGAHLTQRVDLSTPLIAGMNENVAHADYVLLNRRVFKKQRQVTMDAINQAEADPNFQLSYKQDGVFLFTRKQS